MKYKKLILLFLIGVLIQHSAFAQNVVRYFLLDSVQQKGLKFNHIKCADANYKAELFNVLYNDFAPQLVLFTALPDYARKEPIWKPINLDSIGSKMVSIDTLKKEFSKAFKEFFNTQGVKGGYKFKSMFIRPIVKIGNAYFSPSTQVLMEHFVLHSPTSSFNYITNVFPNLNQFFEINTDASIFPLAKFEDIYLKKFNHPSFNSHYSFTADRFNTHYVYNKPILLRDENTMIDGKTAYKYWTLASWPIDGYNSERGIDRFAYIPEYGIVSGAYSFYFWAEYLGRKAHPLTEERKQQLIQNYLKDVQLMPYEINGKPVAK